MVTSDLKISICIPTWEQHGHGKQFLRELFDSIKVQTFKNFNVVISDHSIDDDIKSLVDEYSSLFDIVYVKNEEKRGNGPANTNNTLKQANGEIIKVMFQDDFFVHEEALQKIHDTFENGDCKWVVNGCNHTTDGENFNRPMVPSWNDRILDGVNTISSPSVLSIKNEDIPYFDESLVMLMDCEYYYQLYVKHGKPTIVDDILITNRMHQYQISTQYNKNINEEISYAKQKHERF